MVHTHIRRRLTAVVVTRHISGHWSLLQESRFITPKPHFHSLKPMDSNEEEDPVEETMDEEAEQILREAEAVARRRKRLFYIS